MSREFERKMEELGKDILTGLLSLFCLVFLSVDLSCLALPCLVLSCLVLSFLFLSCLVLFCRVVSCLVLSCLCALSFPVIPYIYIYIGKEHAVKLEREIKRLNTLLDIANDSAQRYICALGRFSSIFYWVLCCKCLLGIICQYSIRCYFVNILLGFIL
jgi:hypothetical protein